MALLLSLRVVVLAPGAIGGHGDGDVAPAGVQWLGGFVFAEGEEWAGGYACHFGGLECIYMYV